MRLHRLAIDRADLPFLATGAFLTLAAAAASARIGGTVSLGLVVGVTFFFLVVAGFMTMPYLTVAAMIPTFALIPAIKVLAVPWIGPLKDIITLAGITAAAILLIQRAGEGHVQSGDFMVGGLVCFVVGLYVLNLGGSLGRYVAWVQGVRLISEPLLLLLVGMLLPQARRTLRWAIVSLVATGVFVALVGVAQQIVGDQKLVELGYSYTIQVRSIGNRLRSFGTMDEPFAYAGFLLLTLAGCIAGMKRSIPSILAGAVITLGVVFAYVRTSLVIALALVALWLARGHRPTIAAFLLAVAVTSAAGILIWSSSGTQSRTVRAGPSLFLTINGRTQGWKVVLDNPRTWMIGKGVGKVGVAAERATYTVTRRQRNEADATAVDSGYFALIADVGFIGLVAFLALVARLCSLAIEAIRRGSQAGWLAIGFLSVLLLDAVTRDSFTGFPAAFLGLFLVGLCIAAAEEERKAAEEDQASAPA